MINTDTTFSGIERLILKYGNVNAKLTINTLDIAPTIPYTYPSVYTDIRNTHSTSTDGIRKPLSR